MTETPSIQWFPGHMAKTRRMIKASLPLVDAVAEIIDARIPSASRNPELGTLIEGKPRIVIMNKCGLADENATALWLRQLKAEGSEAIAVDCKSGKGLDKFPAAVNSLLVELIRKNREKGMSGRHLHLMVTGIPNVGKSTFINCFAPSKKAAAEDRPGVTKDKQWVKVNGNIELLDMPGLLWPKFEDKEAAERLAFTGAVKDDVVDTEALACRLLMLLNRDYHDNLKERYKYMPDSSEEDGYELLCMAGKSRGMLLKGGEINTERAAAAVLDEFRSGKLGRITLERMENRN